MSVNLSELNEAITTAREDRALCLASLRSILVRLKASEADLAMFAKLDGDLHERGGCYLGGVGARCCRGCGGYAFESWTGCVGF